MGTWARTVRDHEYINKNEESTSLWGCSLLSWVKMHSGLQYMYAEAAATIAAVLPHRT